MIYGLNDTFNFGKYKSANTTINEAIEDDLAYVEWCVHEIEWFKLSQEALDLVELHQESILEDDYPEDDEYDMSWHEGHPSNFGDR